MNPAAVEDCVGLLLAVLWAGGQELLLLPTGGQLTGQEVEGVSYLLDPGQDLDRICSVGPVGGDGWETR